MIIRWTMVLVLFITAGIGTATGGRFLGSERAYPDAASRRAAFAQWLVSIECRDDTTRGLYPYFRSDDPSFVSSGDDFLSPMVSAKCVMFWLHIGRPDRAFETGHRLLAWQRALSSPTCPRTSGALPSEIIRRDGSWHAGTRFYSGDNLVVLEAFIRLFQQTGRGEFYEGALASATWIRDVMCHGENYGVWSEPHGAPMHFVTAGGAFDNTIYTGVEFMWLYALRHFAEISGDSSYVDQFNVAKQFLLRGQSAYGVWFDRYDPGYPPRPYNPGYWLWYGPRGQYVADNALRAAIGALRAGAPEQAGRFADAFRIDRGAVPAYYNATTGKPQFANGDGMYYDVVSSGLWVELVTGLERWGDARGAQRFLVRTQNRNGGWYWGLWRSGLRPVQRSEAVLTGIWAVRALERKQQARGDERRTQ